MKTVYSKQPGIKVPKFGLVFGTEGVEVSDEVAEELLKLKNFYTKKKGKKGGNE